MTRNRATEQKNLAISARMFKWLLAAFLSLQTLVILGGVSAMLRLICH
jgi:hypothetical protein